MPILFNEPNSETLLSVIKREVGEAKNKGTSGWVFYVITCYFGEKTTKELVTEVKKILGDDLSGVHILVDSNEWIKSLVDRYKLVNNLCEITKLCPGAVTFTPIYYPDKLFHAKSYALINSQIFDIKNKDNGIAIITSGNLTNRGLRENIEIGQIIHDVDSLNNFVSLFLNLKNNYEVSPHLEKEQRKFQLAVQVLSKGVFYHEWRYQPKLTISLKLSSEEIKRLKKLANDEETRKKIAHFKLKKTETIKDDPINIKSIFKICPKPIPASLWRNYSIDTLIGQWVPLEISKLIENEIKESRNILDPLLAEKGNRQKISLEAKKLNDYMKMKVQELVIDSSEDNWSEVENWEKRVNRFFSNKDLLNIFICDYEKICLPITKMDRDVIISVHERIKDFYDCPNWRVGLGKIFAQLQAENNDDYNSLDDTLTNMVENAKEILKANRLGDLYKLIKGDNSIKDKLIQEDDNFTVFKISVKQPGEYERLDGIFVKVESSKVDPIQHKLIYKTTLGKTECLLVNHIRTFKKIE